jgi:hypothetical protein
MLFTEIIAVCFGNVVGYVVAAAALQTFKRGCNFTVLPLTVYWKASNYWKRISNLCVVCCNTNSCWALCAISMGSTPRVFTQLGT